jgi:hypothetical protein
MARPYQCGRGRWRCRCTIVAGAEGLGVAVAVLRWEVEGCAVVSGAVRYGLGVIGL